jgi:hypothetical protein
MPFTSEVERDCLTILKGEKAYCRKRVARELVNTERVIREGSAQLAWVQADAVRSIALAEANAEASVARTQARLQKDQENFAAELARDEQQLEMAKAQCRDRVQAAQNARDAAKVEAATRVSQAQQAARSSVDVAEKAAVDAEELESKRAAELDASVAAAEAAAARVRGEAESRTVKQVEEHKQRAARMQQDAQARYERLLQDAASSLELYFRLLAATHVRVAAEIESRGKRVQKEVDRTQFYIQQNELARVSETSQRSLNCKQLTQESKSEALQRVRDAQTRYQTWRTKEQHLTAEQLEALGGLEEIALQLRSSTLAKGMTEVT